MKLKTFVFNPIQVNCYLLWDETKEAILIDCGCLFAKEKMQLKQFIEVNGLTIKHYLNTHLHFDHIFGNPFIESTFGIKAKANDADWKWAENISERVARFGLNYTEKISYPEQVLHHGDRIKFGNQTVEVIAVPGHSPGSLAYYIPEQRMVFTGDALFRDSIGRTDFPDSNHQQLIDSIRNNLFTLPNETVVYPGHAEPTDIGYEKEYNCFVR